MSTINRSLNPFSPVREQDEILPAFIPRRSQETFCSHLPLFLWPLCWRKMTCQMTLLQVGFHLKLLLQRFVLYFI